MKIGDTRQFDYCQFNACIYQCTWENS